MIFLSQPRIYLLGMDPAYMTQAHACRVCRKEVPSSTDNGVVWVEVQLRGTELVPLSYSCKKHRPKGGTLMRPFLALIVLLIATLGCDKSTLATAPEATAASAVVQPGAVKAWVEVDGVKKLAWVIEDKGAPRGTYRILYICDGPMIGPIQSGHCRMDGTDCQGPEIGPTGYYAAPTAPPQFARTAADADGIVVR